MAYTSLSDIIEPKTFAQYVAEQVTKKSALIASGAVLTSDALNAYAAQAGTVTDLPFFTEFGYVAPDIAKADSTAATPAAIGSGKQISQKDFLSKTWGTTALTNSVSGNDIVGHIVNNVVAPYWSQALQAYALAKISGLVKDNVANDSGDMVYSVTALDSASAVVTATDYANVSTIQEAVQTMGDARDKLSVIAMHSRVYTNLVKAEATSFEQPSSVLPFRTYNGMIVIVDDTLPVTVGTNRTAYTSYILGAGALLMGEATPDMGAVEIERNATHGNGFGAETLTSRKQVILHPAGFASTATVAAGFGSPTISAYDAASAWNRVVSRKNVPIAVLKTNG